MSLLAAIEKRNPLKIRGLEMQPMLLLVSKLIFLVLVIERYDQKLGSPFIPFVGPLDLFHDSVSYALAIKATFFLGGTLLLLNLKPRMGSVLLGLVLLLHILATRLDFKNHVLLSSMLLMLNGLHIGKGRPTFVYAQFVLIYIGACFNKVLDPDWWTGRFFQNWMENRLNVPAPVELIVSVFPPSLTYAAFGWIAMAMEALIAYFLIVPSKRRAGVWIAACFHFCTFVLSAGNLFGFFIPNLIIGFLVFRPFPRGRVASCVKGDSGPFPRCMKCLQTLLDWDNATVISKSESGAGSLTLEIGGRRFCGFSALTNGLLQMTGLFWCLFGTFSLVNLFAPYRQILIAVGFAAVAAFFFPYSDTIKCFREKYKSSGS